MRLAAAKLNPLPGTRIMPARIASGCLAQSASAAGDLDLESMCPLVTSTYPELREPADPAAAPTKAVAPVVFNGRIDRAGESDRYVIVTTPGERLRIRVEASEFGSALDGVLQVLGKNGSVIANADDTNIVQPARAGQQPQTIVTPDPSLDLTIPGNTNEITLTIRDLENRGGIGFPYRIVVEPLLPDFELLANESQLSVPRGGTASMGVTVLRKGYSGPITVTVADPPAGLTVRPGTIAAGQTTGAFTMTASPDASFAAAPLKLVGRGSGAEGPFERLATKPTVYAQQNNVPMNSIEHFGLVAAPALAPPVALEAPSAPIEIPHGFSATVPVKIVRTTGADSALEITALPLPAGLAVPKASIAAKAAEGKVTVNAAVAAPLGTTTLVLQAKGKLGGADRVFDLPAVTLTCGAAGVARARGALARNQAGRDARAQGKDRAEGAVRCTCDRQDQRAARRSESRPCDRCRQRLELRNQGHRRGESRRGHRRHADRHGISGREEGLFGSAYTVCGEGCRCEVSFYLGQLAVVSGQLCDKRRLCSGDHSMRRALLSCVSGFFMIAVGGVLVGAGMMERLPRRPMRKRRRRRIQADRRRRRGRAKAAERLEKSAEVPSAAQKGAEKAIKNAAPAFRKTCELHSGRGADSG